MRKFVLHTLLFGFLAMVFVELTCAVLLYTDVYLFNYPGYVIHDAIKKSKTKSNKKILLLGDSVGHQLFPNKDDNDSIYSLACNQAISLAGQYVLLHNYINTGAKFEKLVLFITPFSFRNNLDQMYTYHYFLKPFDNDENRYLFTNSVKEQIAKIPYHRWHSMPHIAATTWAPDYISKDTSTFTFLSPISIEYLHKIRELSKLYNFSIKIVSPPISISKREAIDSIYQNEIRNANLENEFANYFNLIAYRDSALFSDGTHFNTPEQIRVRF